MNDILLNWMAQNPDQLGEHATWFAGLSVTARAAALLELVDMVSQAHPRLEEVDVAIARSGLRPSFTPCVMLKQHGTSRTPLLALTRLPRDEQEKTFRLLLSLFRVADDRRMTQTCGDSCGHWWHRRLDDPRAGTTNWPAHHTKGDG